MDSPDYTYVCLCVYWCTCRRPEDHIGVVLLLPTLFFCNRVSHRSSVYQLAKAGWLVTPRYLPIYPSCAGNTAICWKYSHMPQCLVFSMWVLGIQFRISCLQGRHVTDWIISLGSSPHVWMQLLADSYLSCVYFWPLLTGSVLVLREFSILSVLTSPCFPGDVQQAAPLLTVGPHNLEPHHASFLSTGAPIHQDWWCCCWLDWREKAS